jgi:hypothetical protein
MSGASDSRRTCSTLNNVRRSPPIRLRPACSSVLTGSHVASPSSAARTSPCGMSLTVSAQNDCCGRPAATCAAASSNSINTCGISD